MMHMKSYGAKVPPKMQKLFDVMEDIFGTVAAPVVEVEAFEPTAPECGADERGAYYAHEIHIIVKIDSRPPRPSDVGRPAPLPPSGGPKL